ncbi:MAG: IS4 family transposase [Rhodospirillaceae bacterium]|nr:IS4 family transposase [Rhodospirillaceae bacterium]
MDPRITNLESTTFFGRRLTRRQIADIQETVALLPNDSRSELAKTICEHLNWHTPKGDYRVSACLRMLERLEGFGILTLPEKRDNGSGALPPIRHTAASDPQPEIACDLSALEPLSLRAADGHAERAEWNELVDRHHYLGCPRPFGPHLRWFVLDRDGRRLGCLLFEAASRTLPARDEWIGWSERDRERRLHLALGNSRFIVFPWVAVPNLASRVLGMAAARLPGEWERRHGCRPVLCETFVDPTRFDGACYRAANWERIGMTAGRKSGRRAKPAKEILVLPLDRGFRDVLRGRESPARSPRPPRPDLDDPLVAAWLRIIDAATALAEAHDRRWMKRRRVLNSLIVMLFVFRLVLSRREKGYATVTAELWEQCRKLGIALPQREPVVASSICKARQRVHEELFLDLHREILRHGGDGARWKGRRVFAVDGTKMNLPRGLVDAGYPLPKDGAHYPQGLVSCLYRLDTKVPVDFSLSARACERTAALGHLHALEAGDVVVFDRGYFSFELLHAVIRTGAHPVFRLQANGVAAFRDFMAGDGTEAVVAASPGPDTRRELARRRPGERFDPVDVRLVRCRTGGDGFNLATTLLDADDVSADDLGALYQERWSIEELYKVSKQTVAVDEFHGQTERGVRQELYAHFNLIAMTRLLSGHGDGLLADMREDGEERQTVNFRNAIAVVGANLEETLLAQVDAVARAVTRMAERILKVRSRLRPGRTYPRKSMKPVSKWNRRRATTT